MVAAKCQNLTGPHAVQWVNLIVSDPDRVYLCGPLSYESAGRVWHQSPQTTRSDTISCSTHEIGFTFKIFVGSINFHRHSIFIGTQNLHLYIWYQHFTCMFLMFYIHFASHKNVMYGCCVTFILNVTWGGVLYPTRLYHILLWQMNDNRWSAL